MVGKIVLSMDVFGYSGGDEMKLYPDLVTYVTDIHCIKAVSTKMQNCEHESSKLTTILLRGDIIMNKLKKLILAMVFNAKIALQYVMTYRHKALLSNPSYHDDLYIVSFPKSGATWMNFLMANIHLRSYRGQ